MARQHSLLFAFLANKFCHFFFKIQRKEMAASQMKIKQRDTIWQVPILWKHNADVPLVEISTRHFLVFPFRRKEQALDQEVPINDPIESYSSFSSNPTHKHSLFCHPKNSQYRIMLSYECAEKRRLLLRILFTKTGPHLSKDEAQKLEAVMLPKSHFKWQEFIFCQYKWRDEVQRSVIQGSYFTTQVVPVWW
jgi:hypothetical protein